MKRDEKAKQMMDQISCAYGDEFVNTSPEIKKMLFENAQVLEKTEDCGLVATKICKEIALYALSHQQDFPEALGTLHNQLKSEAMKYDATAMTAILLPLWFWEADGNSSAFVVFSEYHFVKLFHYADAEKLKKVETPSMMQSRVKNEPL